MHDASRVETALYFPVLGIDPSTLLPVLIIGRGLEPYPTSGETLTVDLVKAWLRGSELD